MKKLLLFLISLFAIAACEKIDGNLADLSNQKDEQITNYDVSMNEAMLFAKSLVHENETSQPIKDIEVIAYKGDTLPYLVNFPVKGWAVISGDKRTEPLLAFNELSVEELSLESIHNGIFTWLDEKAGLIYGLKSTVHNDTTLKMDAHWAAKKSTMIIPPDEDGYWRRVLINTSTVTLPSYLVGPLMNTKWGQGEPWNTCVPFGELHDGVYPRCMTGCVAVATAQIMYYGHYKSNKPSWMYENGSCTGYSWDGYKNYSFNFSNGSASAWDDMILTRKWYGYPGAHEVAILMGYVGNKLDMDYGRTESGASSSDVPGVLNDFGITSNYQGYNYDKVISNLNSSKPV